MSIFRSISTGDNYDAHVLTWEFHRAELFEQLCETKEEHTLQQGAISDRLSNFDTWGDRIRPPS